MYLLSLLLFFDKSLLYKIQYHFHLHIIITNLHIIITNLHIKFTNTLETLYKMVVEIDQYLLAL